MQRIIDWLSGFMYQTKHQNQLEKRAPDTGSWVLNAPEFREWESAGQPLLWLKGNGLLLTLASH